MREVRRLRQEKGWNQTELAFYAGLAPSVISQIETGKRDPNAATLRKLADALGVDVPDLFERSESLKAQSPLPSEEVGGTSEERRAISYDACADALDNFSSYWGQCQTGSLDPRTLKEFRRAEGWLIPWVNEVWETQIDEARRRYDREPRLEELSLWPAIDRYMTLQHKIGGLTREKPGADNFQEAQVIDSRGAQVINFQKRLEQRRLREAG